MKTSLEHSKCDCAKGLFEFPNDYWRNILKEMRCNWCGKFTIPPDHVGGKILSKRKND